jgi:hypothetical protein
MKVLGYHISDKGVINSDGETSLSLSLVEFLLQPKDGTIRVLYDLDYSIGSILKSLKLTVRETAVLCDTTKFRLPPYQLRYVTGKFLSIKRVNAFSYFSNASQYSKRNTDAELTLQPLTLAKLAESVGKEVLGIFSELGIEAESLTSPARAYERTQVRLLLKEMQSSSSDMRRKIIDSIGLEVFGRTWEKYLLER